MTDEHNPSVGPVAEFEGEFVRLMEGKMPGLTITMPEGYKRNMHLVMQVECRVRSVDHPEDKKTGDLTRMHNLALEEVRLIDAFHPDARPNNVGGSLASDVGWKERLMAFVEGEDDELEIDESDDIPDRLRALLGFQPRVPDDARDLSGVQVEF